MSDSKKILQKILLAVESQTETGQVAVVFDLDSTLFDVSPRTRAILRELAESEEFRQQYPVESKALGQLEIRSSDWGIRQALTRAQLVGTIEFFEIVRKHWMKHFFSSSHLHLDEVYPGAVEFTQRLANAGAAVLYLTGRDEPRMGSGTRTALEKWQFPLNDPSHLHMKPRIEAGDIEFKQERFHDIKKSGFEKIWFFENEPAIIHPLRMKHPEVEIVFVDTIHSGKAEAPIDLPVVRGAYHWE